MLIKLNPHAQRTQVLSLDQDLFGDKILRVSVNAPPEKGKANEELIRFLADIFSLSKSSITLLRGQTQRVKLLEVRGDPEACWTLLKKVLGTS